MPEIHIHTSELRSCIKELHTFDRVLLSGTIYTARDAAHKKLTTLIKQEEPLPFELKESVIYYAGPTPTPKHLASGSFGPTTSGRMDVFAPTLLNLGLCGMIGKGERNQMVKDAIVRNHAVYLCAVGGAGALACKSIVSCEVIAFEELGCESIKRLEIEKFPLIVAIDSTGKDIFIEGPKLYLSQEKSCK